jgi:hypothetical protein
VTLTVVVYSQYSQSKRYQDEMVNRIVDVYNQLDSFNDDYLEKLDELDGLLLQFFQAEASLSFDMSTALPFSSLVSSDDGKVRVFSWFTENGGQAWEYHALIQYKIGDGVLKAELTKMLFVGVRRNRWLYVPQIAYNSIGMLRQNTYCLFGGARSSSRGTVYYCYLAVELTDNSIFPYLAFNGKSYMGFDLIAIQPPNIEDLPGFVDIKPSPFPNAITLIYAYADALKNKIEKEYHFVFNGKEFEGDYSILGR